MENKEPIYSYTRKQAVEDGEQVLLDSQLTKEAAFNYPVYITDSVYVVIEQAINEFKKDFTGIVWDILSVLHTIIKSSKDDSTTIEFSVFIGDKDYKLFAQIGATDIDDPQPAITIMRQEDL